MNKAEIREKMIKEMVSELKETGAPANVVQLYAMQIDNCACAWVVAKAAAKQLHQNGDIESDQIFEVTLELAKIVAMKITHGPPKQPGGGLLVPPTQLPGDITLN